MYTGFLHTHTLVVTLFFLFLLFKVGLLLFGKKQLLDKIRMKYKAVDAILGSLILITGFYLAFNFGWPAWLIVKIVLVLAAIPLAIVGLKRGSKVLSVFALLAYTYSYGIAETNSLTMTKPEYVLVGQELTLEANLEAVTNIYRQECMRCHGERGNAMQLGAKDLTKSQLTNEEIVHIITNGKAAMPDYKHLGEDQIQLLAQYVESLRVKE